MVKLPIASARECIQCLQRIGYGRKAQSNNLISKKNNISPTIQHQLFINYNLLIDRKKHGFCDNCFNDTNSFDFNNVSEEISINNIDNLKTSLNDLSKNMKNLENNQNTSKNIKKNGLIFNEITNDDCKNLTGLEKSQIKKISEICGIFNCFKIYFIFLILSFVF